MMTTHTASECVPADLFWNTNRALAQRWWPHDDGGTISQRIAELASSHTGMPVSEAKTMLHVMLAVILAAGLGVVTFAVAKHPLLAIAGVGATVALSRELYTYLQLDRC